MLFNFRLRPVERIVPWRHEDQPALHWFGLTDGWYWMNVGTDELFRYTDDVLGLWGLPPEGEKHLPYVDYQVVRLWEDIQEKLPSILELVPDYVLQQVQPYNQAFIWWDQLENPFLSESDVPDSTYDLFDQATSWFSDRWLDVGYLNSGPRICFWTQEQSVVIHWDNRNVRFEGIPVWTAKVGTITLPLEKFIDEFRAFDQRLMQEMQDRVAAIQQHWSRPEIALDIPGLVQEHQERATWMERCLEQARHRSPTSWDSVRDALESLQLGGHLA